MQKEPLLHFEAISKQFSGVYALKDAEMTIYPGEVLALIGENGAGKSTCVKVMTGLYQPDTGTITYKGKEVHFANALEASQAGIAAIHQETVLFDDLSITENIFMGHQVKKKNGLLDWSKMRQNALLLLDEVNLKVDPDLLLGDLSLGQQHMVAIARALAQDSAIVIMDEPTASLSFKEIEELYLIIEKLKQAGKGILFISHKFDEIFRIADRFVVYRDGVYIQEGSISEVTENDLVKLMVGRLVTSVFPKRAMELGAIFFEVEGLGNHIEFEDISFKLKKREILGFYGLVGAGRSELMKAIMQLSSLPLMGEIRLNGKKTEWHTPNDVIHDGLVYVPEDRRKHGVITPMSIRENISLPSLKSLSRYIFPSLTKERSLALKFTSLLKVKANHLEQKVEELSGGNQQKIVLSRWLATDPTIVIVDEPTRGIDIGAKSSVHEVLAEMVEKDLSVLMVSSELPELMGMADRIIVMRLGKIVASFDRADFNAEVLAGFATGAITDQSSLLRDQNNCDQNNHDYIETKIAQEQEKKNELFF